MALLSLNVFVSEGHAGASSLPYLLPHPSSGLRGSGSILSDKVEPGLSFTASTPPALIALNHADFLA